MQTTARAGCWPWGLGDARVGHTVMTPEQRSRCDGAARCPPCPVGAPKRLSALAPTLSGAGTATVIWGKIEADAERMASRACHNGPASARCGPRRRGRRDWAGRCSGFVGPPGTAPRRPRPRPCCCCSCRNGGHLRGQRAPAAGWAPGPRPRTTRRSPRGCGRPGWGRPPTAGAPPEAARRTCPSCPGSAGERPS